MLNLRMVFPTLAIVASLITGGVLSAGATHPFAGTPNGVTPPSAKDCSSTTTCFTVRQHSSGDAIDAKAIQGFAVQGLSAYGEGVVGITENRKLQGAIASGIWGRDMSPPGTGGTYGVEGDSHDNIGVLGVAQNDHSQGLGAIGVVGDDGSSGSQSQRGNVGVIGFSHGTGVIAYSDSPAMPAGGPQFPALNAVCARGGLAMVASDGFVSPSGDTMSLDCTGNMILKGTVTSGGTPLVRVQTSRGAERASYASTATTATFEDFGQGQLVDGRAYVRIAADFASSTDGKAKYLVFLTPGGPNRGLYVTDKTGAGFTVRENPGGRATIPFDYRIVAKPLGPDAGRLPTLASVRSAQFAEAMRVRHNAPLPPLLARLVHARRR
jgi:hypothetical protein